MAMYCLCERAVGAWMPDPLRARREEFFAFSECAREREAAAA